MTNLDSALGPGPEFDKIRSIWSALGENASAGGDDCAIVRVGLEQLALSTDLHIEGVHFRLGWLEPWEVGWRATAAALSDLAAVAAQPEGLLLSLGVSAEWPDEFVTELMSGVGQAAESVGAVVWGGDLVRADSITIDVAVVGRVEKPVYRAGASAGDALWVTGTLGGPQAAIESWTAGTQPEETARHRFAHPLPRVREARWLADRGAKAMIDLSDGLVADVGHLAAAGGVRCVIDSDLVPQHAAASGHMPLLGGEEFELLVALPSDADAAADFSAKFSLPLTCIGHVESGSGVSVTQNGAPVDLPQGFRHF
jgi:thiamine-monophosphate kinase